MNSKLFFLLMLLPVSVWGSENQGIESANYEGRFAYNNSNYWDTYTFGLTANLPVSGNLGSNISAIYQSSNGKSFSGGEGLDSTTTGIYATLFLSDESNGKAGALLTYAKSKYDFPGSLSSFKNNQESKGYGIFGNYYLNHLTVFAGRNYHEDNNNFSIYTSNFGLAYYITVNTAIGVSGSRVYKETDYGLVITHQPSLLNNNTELTFSYDRDSEDRDFDSYTLSLNYYFGTRVSLIDRDRKYR